MRLLSFVNKKFEIKKLYHYKEYFNSIKIKSQQGWF